MKDKNIEPRFNGVVLGDDGKEYLSLENYLENISIKFETLFNAQEFVKLKECYDEVELFISKNEYYTEQFNNVLKDWIIKINDIFIIDDSNKFASMDVFFNTYLKKEKVTKTRIIEKIEEKSLEGFSYFFNALIGNPTTYQIKKNVTEEYYVEDYSNTNISFLCSKKQQVHEALKKSKLLFLYRKKIIELYKNIFNDLSILRELKFYFGNYWQSNNNTKEPIDWLVLDVEKGKRALLLSKYALDCKQYHRSNTDITWEGCDLRKWLNTEFINNAFSKDEQEEIQLSEINNDNPRYRTRGGYNTKDKIFLLSIEEARKYFNSYEKRQCKPTQYAVNNNAYIHDENGMCYWWLRSAGYGQYYAAIIGYGGGTLTDGIVHVNNDHHAVRVALWVNL